MPSGEDEAVASRPLGVAWVMAQVARPEGICHRGCSHWEARMARVGLLDSICSKEPDGVDCTILEIFCHKNPAYLGCFILPSAQGRYNQVILWIIGRFHLHHYTSIAEQFTLTERVLEVHEFGNGNINDTYLVITNSNEEPHFVLQRINTLVFRQPRLIMQNMRIFTEYMRKRARQEGYLWEIPRVLKTHQGEDFYLDNENRFWRAISYVKGARSFDTINSIDHAWEVGHALGTFQRLISDLPVESLCDTLEGFHVTPRYLEQYDRTVSHNGFASSAEVRWGMEFVSARRQWAHVLEDARSQGKLQLRPVHGDPKVNNVMIQEGTGRAISLVDLDTVKPGLIHYDIGDCMRSGCNRLGEETEQWEAVRFDPEIGEAILTGYLTQARHFLTEEDYEYLFDSIRLISFELGLRFFTDHLAGNVYFKVKHARHNLIRALVQFKLVESIEAHEGDIRSIIQNMVSRAV